MWLLTPGPERPAVHRLAGPGDLACVCGRSPGVLDGTGLVFDRAVALDDTADGYAAMDKREALKVLVRP